MFLTNRFYYVAAAVVTLFVAGYVATWLYVLALMAFGIWMVLSVWDLCRLYVVRSSEMKAERLCADRFSNGDANEVTLTLVSPYGFRTYVEVIDEVPVEFEMRDFALHCSLDAHEEHTMVYSLTPRQRGLYRFGRVNAFFSTRLRLVQRRFQRIEQFEVKVYPSFAKLSLYSLICNHQLDQMGVKRIRRVGADTDFEQIKDYFEGDEYRHINWKASARANTLKVNVYQQDRSMPVYSVVDKGRMMQQSAHGLTFLEHSINAALALSYVAMKKDDQAGLVAFSDTVETFVPAQKQGAQMQKLMEALYNQQTAYGESDYLALSTHFSQRITKRSFVMLFDNFSTLNSFEREAPYLQLIAHHHQLMVIIFRDREMEEFINQHPTNTEVYCQRSSVERYYREKRQIIKQLRLYNILTIYAFPEQLSVSVINRYMQIRQF